MKSAITLVLLLFLIPFANGQRIALTIEQCYAQAQESYPLIAQRDLIERTKAFSVENALKGHLPQINVSGQATYQSDVVRIPVEMPGVEPLSKDQYRISGEVAQRIYHGGTVRRQKELEEINAGVEAKMLEVELYQIHNRINELFFGILLLRDQKAQSLLVKDDLVSALKKVEAGIQHGTALRSAADVIRAELLRMDQRIIELQSSESAYLEMLSIFLNQQLDEGTVFERPDFDIPAEVIPRPEVALFDFQKQSIEAGRQLLLARKRPKMELFVQAGYGRPGLNMLENKFDFYYLGGLRLQWSLSGYYTFRRENEIMDLRVQSVDVQKETFLFNTRLTAHQHSSEISRLRQLIDVDEEIISLRERVLKTAAAQLEQGVISSTDYVREVNAADQAKQNRALHQTQLLLALAKYRFTIGQ